MKYPHWEYYRSILRDLETVSRYVEISRDNYGTYGTEFTRLLLSVCSEVDVVAKLLCKNLKRDGCAKNIEDYQRILTSGYPGLVEVEVAVPKYLIPLKPWCDWRQEKTPKWWSAHNKVKHKRDEHFRDANLENVLFATGGLCVLVSYFYYKELQRLVGIRELFMFLDAKYRTGMVKSLVKQEYVLPDFADCDR